MHQYHKHDPFSSEKKERFKAKLETYLVAPRIRSDNLSKAYKLLENVAMKLSDEEQAALVLVLKARS